MATPSTVAVENPALGLAAEPPTHANRFRRMFRRRARRRRTLRDPHSSWRDEATMRTALRV
jgi:hypothetical protein